MSSSSQTISLYFGDISSHVGTSFWNIQHNLLNCQESNDFVDIDQMFLQAENINSQKLTPMALFFNMKLVNVEIGCSIQKCCVYS